MEGDIGGGSREGSCGGRYGRETLKGEVESR